MYLCTKITSLNSSLKLVKGVLYNVGQAMIYSRLAHQVLI